MKFLLCNCGRIHVIQDGWDWIAEDYKTRSIIHVCTNCGNTVKMFLNDFDEGYATNVVDFRDQDIEGFFRIITSNGIKVYLMTGTIVDTVQAGYFVNEREYTSAATNLDYKSLDHAYQLREPWCTVDTQRLIKDFKEKFGDKADSILRQLAGYVIKIDWKGTEYDVRRS